MADKRGFAVFVSYDSRDRDWVSKFASALEQEGVRAWVDQAELRPGDRWHEKLEDAIRTTDTMVFVLSPHSQESSSTYFELGAAIAGGKKVIPVAREEMDISAIAPHLRQFQILAESSPETAGHRVAEVVKAGT